MGLGPDFPASLFPQNSKNQIPNRPIKTNNGNDDFASSFWLFILLRKDRARAHIESFQSVTVTQRILAGGREIVGSWTWSRQEDEDGGGEIAAIELDRSHEMTKGSGSGGNLKQRVRVAVVEVFYSLGFLFTLCVVRLYRVTM